MVGWNDIGDMKAINHSLQRRNTEANAQSEIASALLEAGI
jgi:hypothetical protein